MDALWGKEPSTVGGNLGLLRRIRIDALEGKFFRNPASVRPVSSGRFGGNETSSYGVTSVTTTREIQGLSTVGQYEDILRSI